MACAQEIFVKKKKKGANLWKQAGSNIENNELKYRDLFIHIKKSIYVCEENCKNILIQEGIYIDIPLLRSWRNFLKKDKFL